MFRCCFALFLLFFTSSPSCAQRGSKKEVAADVYKDKVIQFIRLTNKRAAPDSLIRLIGFPFYFTEEKLKVYNTARELYSELRKNNKKTKLQPVIYTIDTIYNSGIFDKIPDALHGKITFVFVKLFFPFAGEGKQGQWLNSVFFVGKKYPYKVFGITNLE
jgi:hypothetical protein